jgi:hypothetical protein
VAQQASKPQARHRVPLNRHSRHQPSPARLRQAEAISAAPYLLACLLDQIAVDDDAERDIAIFARAAQRLARLVSEPPGGSA